MTRTEHQRECDRLRELLEMRRRRCIRDMENAQKEIDQIDRQIEVMELKEQAA